MVIVRLQIMYCCNCRSEERAKTMATCASTDCDCMPDTSIDDRQEPVREMKSINTLGLDPKCDDDSFSNARSDGKHSQSCGSFYR